MKAGDGKGEEEYGGAIGTGTFQYYTYHSIPRMVFSVYMYVRYV